MVEAHRVSSEVLRYAAFTCQGTGGNPAGVVLDAGELADQEMQRLASQIGYSETAFVVRRTNEPNVYDVRFFTPVQEVPFCGHATIAAAVALAERTPARSLQFHTRSGLVTVQTDPTEAGIVAELTSVAPRVREPEPDLVAAALAALRWSGDDLDPDYPPRLANAGAEHLILVVGSHGRLQDLDYDFDRLAVVMQDHGLVTCQLIWPESEDHFHSRNPFAANGVIEDPATGAAAAAFGGYLRDLGLVPVPSRVTLHQGYDMGSPSRLLVDLAPGVATVDITGGATPLALSPYDELEPA
jgi:PhzF family phenazine biosynthesis protein